MAGRSTTEWYREKEKLSPIVLNTDLDPKKMETVIVYGYDRPPNEADRRERKSTAHVHGGKSPEMVLTCLSQFDQMRVDLHLFNNDLFIAYRKTLKVGLQTVWDAHTSSQVLKY